MFRWNGKGDWYPPAIIVTPFTVPVQSTNLTSNPSNRGCPTGSGNQKRRCHPSTGIQVTALAYVGASPSPPCRSTGQPPALSHDGRGDKRAFDRLRPNVLSRGCAAVTDAPTTAPRAGHNAAQGERDTPSCTHLGGELLQSSRPRPCSPSGRRGAVGSPVALLPKCSGFQYQTRP